MNVYRKMQKDFATGDRIQFTAKDKALGVNNRDLGTITKLETGQITVQLDGKTERSIRFDPAKMRHFDHGYSRRICSYSSTLALQSNSPSVPQLA